MTLHSTGLDQQMSVLGGMSACEIFAQRSCLSKTNESSSLKVVPWCSNTLDCQWKDMSELVWIGNSPDSISIHLVQEYVMRSCRYTTVNSH